MGTLYRGLRHAPECSLSFDSHTTAYIQLCMLPSMAWSEFERSWASVAGHTLSHCNTLCILVARFLSWVRCVHKVAVGEYGGRVGLKYKKRMGRMGRMGRMPVELA